MQIVVRMGDEAREVVVDRRAPDAVVGDLLSALGVDADGIDVDGRFVDRGEGLADAPIPDGAVVTPAAMHGPVGRTRPNAPAWLTVVAGAGSGDRLPLRQGTLVLGRAGDCDLRLDSPTVSERHALFHVDATVQVEDADSSNGTWVGGHPVGRPVTVEVGDTIRVGAVVLRLDGPDPDDVPTGIDRHLLPGNIPFNRPPRPALPPAVPTLAAPPKASEEKRGQPLRIAAMLAPLAMAGALIAITGNIRFALFALLSPVMVLGNWMSTRRQARKQNSAASAAHRAAVAQFTTDLAATQRAERHRREAVATDLGEVLRRVLWPTVRLWERRLHHDDALRLRIGSADVAWDPPVRLPDGEPAPEVADLLATHGRLPTAPVEVELGPGHVVGIVGDRAAGLALARSLLVQATVLHGPADLRLGVFAQPAAASDWQWTAWLPHTHDPSGRIRLLSADHDVSEQILGGILDAWRAATDQRPGAGGLAGGGPGQAVGGPVSLWVIDDLELLTGRRAPARDLLAGAGPPTCGIVLAPTEDRLPSSCTVVIDARSDVGDARVHWPARAERCDDVLLAGLDAPRARQAARALAHFEDPELQVSGGSVPTLVRLLPLLGMDEVTADDVARAWTQGLPDPGPNGPIGVGEDGPVHLDLVTDGPHGLVGGTTGSGKSEMLRSLVAGMSARVDPEHLVFVLVDYKGGSAFDECARLPHTVGMVTDLDEHLGERALVSLEAELHHRERLLRDAGVPDLPEYLRAGAPLGPLPRMVVVIDEFATMAAELPDFLDALVGIAQRGRSLGVHMILATQRPKGAVNANIKANTNLRIALRVQDAADSTDIIDRADAAELDRATPGRAWIRRGHGDLTLVQTALSTAPAGRAPGDAVALGDLRFAPTSAPPPPPGGDGGPTDLGLLVEACRTAFDRSGMAPPRRPWLPMLDADLPLDEVLAARAGGATGGTTGGTTGRTTGGTAGGTTGGTAGGTTGGTAGGTAEAARQEAARQVGIEVPFARADDPGAQARRPCAWRPADGHLAVFGMVGSGTTTALQAVGRALAETRAPGTCHVYGLDFGGGGLAALAGLPHCGAVVPAADREGQFRLIRLLRGEVERRRDLSAAQRAVEPLVAVLLDGVGAFLGEHEGVESQELMDDFRRVFQDGPAVGVVFAVTGERPAALPMRLGALVNQKVLLRLADPHDFSAIGVRPKALPAFVPGRGIDGASGLVVQVGDPGDLVAHVARIADDTPPPERPPVRVGALPAMVHHGQLQAAHAGPPLTLPVGLSDASLTDALLPVHPGDHLTVGGPARSGKSTLLQLLSAQLRTALPDAIQVALCDATRSPLHGWPSLDAAGSLAGLTGALQAGLTHDRPWFVFVDDAPLLADHDGLLASLLTARPDLHVIVAGRTDDLRSAYGHWSRPTRQSRTGALLQPNLATDGDVFALRLPRRVPVTFGPGRGFLVVAGECEVVQFATPPDDPPPGTIHG